MKKISLLCGSAALVCLLTGGVCLNNIQPESKSVNGSCIIQKGKDFYIENYLKI